MRAPDTQTGFFFKLPERGGLTPGRAGLILLLVAGALTLRLWLLPLFGQHAAYLTIYPVALLAAVLWGKWAGLFAGSLGHLAADYFFNVPQLQVHVTPAAFIALAVMLASALFFGHMGDRWRASESRYRTLFTSMEEGFQLCELVYDRDGRPHDFRFLEVNPAFERHTGLTRVVGRTVRELVPEIEPYWIDLYARVARTGQPERYENYAHAMGRWYEVYAFSPAKDRFAAISVDVTDRKRAEEALHRSESSGEASERKFRSVFEQAAIGMGRVSFTDLRWTDVNDAFCRMLGYSREEMLRTPWPEMTHPDDLDLDLLPFRRMAAGELDSYTVEKRFRDKAGDYVWAKLTLSCVRDADGRPEYEIAIIEDITDRKVAEDRLVEADRRKNEFLAILSHELRNPLAPIRNSVFILEHAPPDGPQARKAHDVIGRQVTHMTRLIDDLLDVTRISRGKIRLRHERLELCELVRRTAEDHRSIFAAEDIRLEIASCEAPLHAEGDPTRLSQVIGNLLANAAKFTPRGGRVDLSLAREDGTATIRVRDTGAGITPELHDRLFNPFVQADATLDRSKGGLGLGLALVKGIVELHGGSVSVASEGPGRGSEFAIRLPLERAEAVAGEPAPAAPRGDRAKRLKVLVIEDNADAADTLRDALEIGGHAATIARTGRDGVREAHAWRPDVVLCDIGLPDIDGFEVARRLRADPDVRGAVLIALSGYAGPEDLDRSSEAGFTRHLAKPADPDLLDRMLSELADPERRDGRVA